MIKILILSIIKLYWWVIPDRLKPRCLFTESCSKHVFNTAKREGGKAGLLALKTRWHHCRAGYFLYQADNGTRFLCTSDGTVYEEEKLSKHILSDHNNNDNEIQ